MSFDIDDPRLTAFALGELEGDEAREIESLLAREPEARRLVEEIKLTAGWLSEQLHREQARETAALADAKPAPPRLVATDAPRPPRPWWRSPSILSSIAATLMVGTALALWPAVRSARDAARVDAVREWHAVQAPASPAPPVPAADAAMPESAVSRGRRLGEEAADRKADDLALGLRPEPSSAPGTSDLAFSAKAPAPSAGMMGAIMRDGPGSPADAAPAERQSTHSANPRTRLRSIVPNPEEAGPPAQRNDFQPEGRQAGMTGAPHDEGRSQMRANAAQPQGQDEPGRSQAQSGQPSGLPQAGPQGQASGPSKPGRLDFGRGGQPGQDRPASLSSARGEGPMEARFRAKDQHAFGGEPTSADKSRMAIARSLDDSRTTVGTEVAEVKREAEVALRDVEAPALRQLEEKAVAEAEVEALADAPEARPAAADFAENPFVPVSQESTSTFSIDVDTASYSIVRRSLLQQNRMPAPGEVRIEEMLNYFPYQDPPPPASSPDPFAIRTEVARCPWAAGHRLARIGIAGRPVDGRARKPSNLAFLVDVSGSMDQPNKLPLVQWGLGRLVEELGENDRVAIVVYAGAAGLVLPSTSCLNKPEILARIDELRAGGSTNGGAGIQLAYDLAASNFINGGINRVILATDGDFNVGVSNQDELVRLIESKAKGPKPVFLTVLGFGMDNLKDGTLEKLADKGNGHYAYIDGPGEARKVLVEELGATLDVIAKDVKIQVEFRPERVQAYRLIGYENRVMANEDFADDRKDAGEIGAGHHVTALYEIVPAPEAAATDRPGGAPDPDSFVVRLRYKKPEGEVSALIERPVADRGLDYSEASDDFQFASAVAGFGMRLRGSPSAGTLTYAGVIELASPTLAHDPSGYRKEFLGLVQRARDLAEPLPAAPAAP